MANAAAARLGAALADFTGIAVISRDAAFQCDDPGTISVS
jgi:hypothetical protein